MESGGKRINVVLVGGGHANVQIMKMLATQMADMINAKKLKVCLFSMTTYAYYSGMLPACISGLYSPQETRMDLKALAKWCGANFISCVVTEIDPVNKIMKFRRCPENSLNPMQDVSEKEETMTYDLLSINVGSTTKGTAIEGAKEHAVMTRPISQLLGTILAFEKSYPTFEHPPKVVVVGAGAAGIELCWGLKARFEKKYGSADVTIVNNQDNFIPENGSWVSSTVAETMVEKKIAVKSKTQVVKVEEKKVYLSDGSELPFDFLVMATGAAPPALLNKCGLELDSQGFIKVGSTLQTTVSPFIFALGDCASIDGYPYVTKAGVYAVREGPVAARNIMKIIKSNQSFDSKEKLTGKLEDYVPQKGFLALLMTGDGRAISSWKGLCFKNSLVWSLKDKIDRAFMEKFDTTKMGPSPVTVTGSTM